MSLNALKAYACDREAVTEGKAFVLARGVKVVLKPYGMQDFYKHYFECQKTLVPDDDKSDYVATGYAMAHAIVMSIGEGPDEIKDPTVLTEVLNDPVYFELRMEITVLAKSFDKFRADQVEDIKND